MKGLKKLIAVLMVIGMLASQFAYAETFVAEEQGFGGTVTAYVTVDDNGKISDVKLVGPNETIGKGSVAIEELPARIIEAGSTDIDGIAGATMTSDAIKKAVDAALEGKVAAEAPEAAEIRFAPGTYSGSAFGFCSMVTVEAEFSEDAIVSVKVTDNSGETPYLRDLAAEKIPAEIVEYQSLNVDSVTGATWGSNAIINAVADCVEQASGADVVNTLKSKASVKLTGEDAEYSGYDLVVVGAGGSGLIAASVASHAGLKVILIEAADRVGGSSEIAGGGTLAIGTELQKNSVDREGNIVNVYDSAGTTAELVFDDIYQQYLDSSHYQANPLMIKRYLEATGEAADFLSEEMGMTFTVSGITGVRYGTIGERYLPIAQKLEEAGNTILLGTRGQHILLNEDGSVAGVEAVNTDTGAKVTVYAKSVLLATGGMSANTEMQKEYAEDYNDMYVNWGSSTALGDGAQMAWEIGAARGRVGTQSHNDGIPIEFHDMFDFDVVNGNCRYAELLYEPMFRVDHRTGRRISDENIVYTPHYHGNRSMMSEGSVLIVDQATIDELMENGTQTHPWRFWMYNIVPLKEPDSTGRNLQEEIDEVIAANTPYAYKADTVAELAELMGVDADVLQNEIDKFNLAVETGYDEEFGRDPATLMYPVKDGPFYALYTNIRNLGTWGGIETDETLGVYGEDGSLIPGLYASGFDALGWLGTSYFVDTTTLGWMTASGYMAGDSIVSYVQGLE